MYRTAEEKTKQILDAMLSNEMKLKLEFIDKQEKICK